jgi:alkanesulfonate monooxygenase SsuD/methylene tetrahydromethanopterin reductase-like flavin-dependent oxidoreductase (luciferase family)
MSATQDRMKVGLDMPLDNRTGLGWKELRDIAMAAEDPGFDSIWGDDHLLYYYEGNAEPNGNRESWAMLTAIAAHTKTVELGHLVLGMGFRNPALLAKIADTVDEISKGRLILGVGAGYHKREYTAFGSPTTTALSGSRKRCRSFTACCATAISTSRVTFIRPATASSDPVAAGPRARRS